MSDESNTHNGGTLTSKAVFVTWFYDGYTVTHSQSDAWRRKYCTQMPRACRCITIDVHTGNVINHPKAPEY